MYLFIIKLYEKGGYKKTSWPAKVDPYYAKYFYSHEKGRFPAYLISRIQYGIK